MMLEIHLSVVVCKRLSIPFREYLTILKLDVETEFTADRGDSPFKRGI